MAVWSLYVLSVIVVISNVQSFAADKPTESKLPLHGDEVDVAIPRHPVCKCKPLEACIDQKKQKLAKCQADAKCTAYLQSAGGDLGALKKCQDTLKAEVNTFKQCMVKKLGKFCNDTVDVTVEVSDEKPAEIVESFEMDESEREAMYGDDVDEEDDDMTEDHHGRGHHHRGHHHGGGRHHHGHKRHHHKKHHHHKHHHGHHPHHHGHHHKGPKIPRALRAYMGCVHHCFMNETVERESLYGDYEEVSVEKDVAYEDASVEEEEYQYQLEEGQSEEDPDVAHHGHGHHHPMGLGGMCLRQLKCRPKLPAKGKVKAAFNACKTETKLDLRTVLVKLCKCVKAAGIKELTCPAAVELQEEFYGEEEPEEMMLIEEEF